MNDLIIDCFAGGGGASVGIEMALGKQVDIAINHDPDAILMHKTNHPNTLHLTEDIFKVDLKKYVQGKRVALMWASPDCTSHSKAKGGKPRERGLRILPWAVYKHAKAILPEIIIMENVEEIQQWGPLDENGHPIKERRGEDYKKFITAIVENWLLRIMVHLQQEKDGMRSLGETGKRLCGRNRHTVKVEKTDWNLGSLFGSILIYRTLESLSLGGRNHLRKTP